MKNNIAMIAAYDANTRGIGLDNTLLWRLPDDMKHFINTTKDSIVVMGRKTYESLPDKFKPLPNRINVVLTNNKQYVADGCNVCHSVDDVLHLIGINKTFIIGGEEIYKLFLDHSSELYLTEVYVTDELEADTFFPDLDTSKHVWHEIERTNHPMDEKHKYEFDIIRLKKLLN